MFRRSHRFQRIVVDGRQRARQAARVRIKEEVEAEYKKQTEEAGLWRRLLLALEARREIRRRLEQAAPRDALYLHGLHRGRA